MASRIKKVEWWGLYAFTGSVDTFQIFIDLFLSELFAAPEVVNEFIDVGMGIGLAAYFQLRGVSLFKHPSRLFSLLGMEALTDVTGGAASFWIADVWYIHKTVKQEDAQENAQKQQQISLRDSVRQPLYSDGVRQPRVGMADDVSDTTGNAGHITTNMKPLNLDGVRAPRHIDTDETLPA